MFDGFQRTRGALRFLASCLHTLKTKGGAKPVLGPADIPLNDPDVLRAMLKDLDPAPGLRAGRYTRSCRPGRQGEADRRPYCPGNTRGWRNVRPALRLATAISGLFFWRAETGEEGSDALPPGVTEAELLAACIGPDLDSVTANSVLSDLRNSCLYRTMTGFGTASRKTRTSPS